MDEQFNDVLFFKSWRNIVINRVIFNFSRLYIKNKHVVFNDLETLREYGEREFITKLEIRHTGYIKDSTMVDDVLSKGDLPKYGVLKELDLTFSPPISNDDCLIEVIPHGIEVINFGYKGKNEIQLSELPNSVNTITNVILKKPYSNNEIPSNIKSISFYGIDPNQFYNIKLSTSSITILDLKCLKYIANQLPLSTSSSVMSSFIPSSVTSLTTFHDIYSKLPTIPNTVTNLNLIIDDCNFKNGLIPFGVKDLTVIFQSYPNSFYDLFPNSLKRISIESLTRKSLQIPKLLHLPPELQYLKVNGKEIDSHTLDKLKKE